MTNDPVLAQHERILAVADRLEEIVAGPHPDRVDLLNDLQWLFTCEVLLHCAQMSDLLAELMADRRADAVSRARHADARRRQFVAAFHAHVCDWFGLPASERWDAYRDAIEELIAMLRRLIDREAREIVPFLPVQPGGAALPAGPRRYA